MHGPRGGLSKRSRNEDCFWFWLLGAARAHKSLPVGDLNNSMLVNAEEGKRSVLKIGI
jgi:hypothetical protein